MLVLKLFTIDAKRINSLSMCEGDCLCMWKGDHLCMCKGDHLCTWKGNYLYTWKGNCLCKWKGDCLCCSWGLMIDAERINSQLSHGKFKRFNLFFLHVGIKTLHYCLKLTHRGSTVSMHEKTIASVCERWLSLHVKRQSPLCMKRQSPLHIERQSPQLILGGCEMMQRGSTFNFHMENSKDLIYFSCILVLKLFTLLFTIDTERINSLCMWKGNCLCMWKGDHLCTWKGDHLCWFWGVGGLTINTERINSQLSHGKFKRFHLIFLHVGTKTVYITVYNWHREDQQYLHVKRWLPLHVKRWLPLHINT